MRTVTCLRVLGVGVRSTCQPARSIARSTTGSRALPASIAVSDSSLGGFVGWYPVAAYQRARRQLPRADDARISMLPVLVEAGRWGGRRPPPGRHVCRYHRRSPPVSCKMRGGAAPEGESPAGFQYPRLSWPLHAAAFISVAASCAASASRSSLAFGDGT